MPRQLFRQSFARGLATSPLEPVGGPDDSDGPVDVPKGEGLND